MRRAAAPGRKDKASKAMRIMKRKTGIAVIEMHGVIGTAIHEPDYSRLLERVAKNRNIGALVLDIDSPGGSATASDILYENVRRVALEKPVVAYVRGLGASGGYYIACGATAIIASRAALIGSIGVIMLRPILQQLLDKMGVEFSVFKAGRLKDMSGFWRTPTDEEADKFQNLISRMYDLFVSVVMDSRRLSDEAVRELATGEVYTAEQAQELKLIDGQGSFDDVISIAMKVSGARRRIKRYKPRRPWMSRLPLRAAGGGGHLAALNSLAPFLTGGVYFLEPGLGGLWTPER